MGRTLYGQLNVITVSQFFARANFPLELHFSDLFFPNRILRCPVYSNAVALLHTFLHGHHGLQGSQSKPLKRSRNRKGPTAWSGK